MTRLEGLQQPLPRPERSEETDTQKVIKALEDNLEGEALVRWMGMKATGTPASSFVRWVDELNATTPEERGLGKRNTSRPAEEHKDITLEIQTGSGFPLAVTLRKTGEVTFSTPLSA